MSWVLLWVLGCGEPDLVDPLGSSQASAELQVESRRVPSGAPVDLVERLEWESGWTAPESSIEVDGLEVALVSIVEGDEAGRNWRESLYALSGEDGSYFLPAGVLVFEGPTGDLQEVNTPAIDMDIGIEGPTSELEGMGALPLQEAEPWKAWAVLLGLVVLGAGLWFWRRKRSGPLMELHLPPPDEEALATWRLARDNPGLDDHQRAVELSRIFRRYLERVMTPFPATRWTQREILDGLVLKGHVDGETLGRCQTLLSATDTLKFARRGGGTAFFEGLDRDLKQVIEQTRPEPEPTGVEEGAGA